MLMPSIDAPDTTGTVMDHLIPAGITNMVFEPIYRVVLHYTMWSDNKRIARTVRRAVPILRFSEAMRISEMAAKNGTAIVITTGLDDAKLYELRLVRLGLRATLETA